MATKKLTGKVVLLVEDDYLVADALRAALEEEGMQVAGPYPSISSATRALDNEERIDAALLDVHLNNERVFPLADRLVDEGIPAIFVTGYGSETFPERFADLPRLSKPVHYKELFACIAELISSNAKQKGHAEKE
ncbi:response regulator [Dyella monticola]|uniref:Response regulator n=1 Tax=Dyella monticola TaxID=1927958 RepID=A0A370WUV5_9GAMM|nr:response regulator [Dyella monticola]RDS79880.1 response regulator [Dyella monticola]